PVRREGGEDRAGQPGEGPAVPVLGATAAAQLPRSAAAPPARRRGGESGNSAGAPARPGDAAETGGGRGPRPGRPEPVRQTRPPLRPAGNRAVRAGLEPNGRGNRPESDRGPVEASVPCGGTADATGDHRNPERP